MKKLIFALAVGLALIARADYIYWMVDNPASGTDISGSATTFPWANAVLTVQDSANKYVNTTFASASSAVTSSSIGGILSSNDADAFEELDAYAYSSIGNDYSGKYILIELFNSDGGWMAGYSALASSLSDYIFGDNSMSTMPVAGFGQGAAYAVPEPTSGLLFLVGGMLLGLRRRRQV